MLAKKCEVDEMEQDGGSFFRPRDYFNWLNTLNYQRRLKSNPLFLYTVFAGLNKKDGEVFLGTTDMWGLKIEHDFILTGLALHYCQVLMQNAWRADLTE